MTWLSNDYFYNMLLYHNNIQYYCSLHDKQFVEHGTVLVHHTTIHSVPHALQLAMMAVIDVWYKVLSEYTYRHL